MKKCPHCNPTPRGRPKKLDDQEVKKLKKKGLGIREIGRKLGVTHGAVRASLSRSTKVKNGRKKT